MRKRTHKLGALGDVAAVIATAPNLSAAARQLGVNRSTLHRWIESGKVALPEKPALPAPEDHATPGEWAAALRQKCTLDAAGEQQLQLAAAALEIARDPASGPLVKLAAMREFRTNVKELRAFQQAEQPASQPEARRTIPKRAGADPRGLLLAVK